MKLDLKGALKKLDKPMLEKRKPTSKKVSEDKSPEEKKALSFDLKNLRRKSDEQKRIPLGEAIFVDLTPVSHKKLVELRDLKKKWFYGVFGVIAFCVAASFVAVGLNAQTAGELTEEQNIQLAITQDTSAYSDVNSALELQTVAIENLNLAAGSELDWKRLISSIEGSLPSGTQISAISVTGGGLKPKNPKDVDVSSVINLNLSSAATIGYSDSLKKIQSMQGVNSVEISGLKSEGSRYTYTLSFTYDTSLLTQRFTLKDSE